jgi:hypothetical protein
LKIRRKWKEKHKKALQSRHQDQNQSYALCCVVFLECASKSATYVCSETYKCLFHKKCVWLQWNVTITLKLEVRSNSLFFLHVLSFISRNLKSMEYHSKIIKQVICAH